MTEDLVSILMKEVGTKESPPNSNNVKYNTWFYGKPVTGKQYAWCMVLISWGLWLIGKPLVGLKDSAGNKVNFGYSRGAAGCSTALVCFDKLGWVIPADQARRNDLVFYDWDGNGAFDHVEVVIESKYPKTFETVGGNTGLKNNSDGGEVMHWPGRKHEIPGSKMKLKFIRIP